MTALLVPAPADVLTGPVAPVPLTGAEPLVLVVDDSAVERRLTARVLERTGRFRAAFASNGVEALVAIGREAPAIVLTDLHMPEMDGLELVEEVRRKFPLVPVILTTSRGSEDVAHRALLTGAVGYVAKRNLPRDLADTLDHVLAAANVDRHRRRALSHLTRRESHFRLENDPALVPAVVSLLQEELAGAGLCDDTALTRVGIALEEALLNALYHGNLEVSSALRQRDDNSYHELARRRREQLPYQQRRLHVYTNLVATEASYVIRDEGPGFDVASLPDPLDPENLAKPSGRGLLLIHAFMDQVSYNQTGNQITLIKRRDPNRGGRA